MAQPRLASLERLLPGKRCHARALPTELSHLVQDACCTAPLDPGGSLSTCTWTVRKGPLQQHLAAPCQPMTSASCHWNAMNGKLKATGMPHRKCSSRRMRGGRCHHSTCVPKQRTCVWYPTWHSLFEVFPPKVPFALHSTLQWCSRHFLRQVAAHVLALIVGSIAPHQPGLICSTQAGEWVQQRAAVATAWGAVMHESQCTPPPSERLALYSSTHHALWHRRSYPSRRRRSTVPPPIGSRPRSLQSLHDAH